MTLADATSGGTWTSSDITIAENTGGGAAFTGVLGGTVTISYTTPGCTPVTASLTVNYIAPITSASYSLCKTDSVLFVDATAGGTWSKVVDTIAALSVVTPGMILGTGSGTSNITYTVGSCYVTQQAFVNGCGHKVGGQSGVVENQVYTLYPNPSNGNVFIAQSIADDGVKEISVMNSVGVKVFSGHIEFSGGKGQINLVVAPGMYVLLMRDQNGDINPFKILIED
jgi:hypothetical protein